MARAQTEAEALQQRQQEAARAMARGQAALAAGDLAAAEMWLDRARRVASGSDAVDLLRGSVALLRQRPAEAATLLEPIARRHDLREAWLGLAAAQIRLGRPHEARVALRAVLAGHAGPWPQAARGLLRACGVRRWAWIEAGRVCCEPAHPAAFAAGRRLVAGMGGRLHLAGADHDLLVDVLDLDRIWRLEGFVEADQAGGLAGWAWYPNDPATAPALRVIGAGGRGVAVTLAPPDPAAAILRGATDRPLAAPRHFSVPRAALPGRGPYRLVGPGGRDLPGSPLDPDLLDRAGRAVAGLIAGRAAKTADLGAAPILPSATPVAPARVKGGARAVSVVVPVFGAAAATRACLASLFAHSPAGTRILVVDDASRDPALVAELDGHAAAGRIRLVRHARNLGFPAAANQGIRAAGRDDVVLLNSDTLVAANWLTRLAAAARSAPDVGTATPLSNDATLLSYPRQGGANTVPDAAEVGRLAHAAFAANGARTADLPTGVGFCLFIRRACLDRVGMFRAEIFAQGYGEENDFCLRASALGFRHVAALGVYVGHVGGSSFGLARPALLARNLALLNQLHPGYDALIAADRAGPGLAQARRALDLARLGAAWRGGPPAALLVTHDLGGGVEKAVRDRAAALAEAGLRPVLLRPVLRLPLLEGSGQCRVDTGLALPGLDLPNLIYDVAGEAGALLRLLRRLRPARLELHHEMGHAPDLLALLARLGLPYTLFLHDYGWFCPRITLTHGEGRYCGEPALDGCRACIADHGTASGAPVVMEALIERSAHVLRGAARIVAPSQDAASRYGRHFPGVRPVVAGWDRVVPGLAAGVDRGERRGGSRRVAVRRVAVLGAIGIEKGYTVLLACARDAARRDLPIHFTVIGHTIDDGRLLDTGCVFVTGEYRPAELPALIAAHAPALAFQPAIWPETWSFTLSEAWSAGLAVVAFDLGAPAERIRAQGGGMLLPLGLPAEAINRALLAAPLSAPLARSGVAKA